MPEPGANQPYDGRLTFVRLRYNMGFGGRRWEPPWAHDYPTADVHMMKILNELTLTRPRLDGSNVMSLADPELHSYPIAYMSEPGFWAMDEDEVKGLRAYLLEGRLHDLRRLPRAGTGTTCRTRCGWRFRRAVDRARPVAAGVAFVLRDSTIRTR